VPLAALRGTQVDVSAGNEHAPEWVDLGVRLLAAFGAEPSPPHLHAAGLEETVQHLRDHGRPILTLVERSLAPGVAVRPLTEPVALYPWTMVYRRELRHPGLDALHASIDELARSERWLELPPGAWIPEPTRPSLGSPSRAQSGWDRGSAQPRSQGPQHPSLGTPLHRPALALLDPADDLRVRSHHLRPLSDAIDCRVHAGDVIPGHDGDDIGRAEQRVRANDPREAPDRLARLTGARVGGGDEHVRFDGHARLPCLIVRGLDLSAGGDKRSGMT
jgi:hypothetical protein